MRKRAISTAKRDRERIPLYEISAFGPIVKSSEFDFDRLERRLRPLPYPHRHDFYQILWMTRGSGPHVIDSVSYPVRDNAIYFLSPGQVHSMVLSEDSTGYVLNVSADFLHLTAQDKNALAEMPFFVIDHPVSALYLNEEQAAGMRRIMEKIEEEYYAEQPGFQDIIRSFLFIFLMLAGRFASSSHETSVAPHDYVLARKFKMLVEDRFLTLPAARQYAKVLKVTERHLSDATKKATGHTANEIIRERMILEAKRLLVHSDLRISEIGNRLSFEDPAYFSRFFKKHTGQSPGDFKKEFAVKVTWL